MIELPAVKRRSFLPRTYALDLLVGLAGVGMSVLAAVSRVVHAKASAGDWFLFAAALMIGVFIMLVQGVKGWREYQRARLFEPTSEPAELVGWAKGLHRQIRGLCDDVGEADGVVRIAVHKVHHDPKTNEPVELEQVINYVGGEGGPLGRCSPVRSGITGVAVRMRLPVDAVRESQDDDEAVGEFVFSWGFTRREAQRLAAGRWAWMAVPIVAENRVVGVVFLDSSRPALFSSVAVRDAVTAQCETLAELVAEMYRRVR